MSLTNEDMRLKFLKGSAILIEDNCAFYPPTIGTIVDFGYSEFWQCLNLLLINKDAFLDEKRNDQMMELLLSLDDFEFFLALTSIDKQVEAKVKKILRILIREEVMFVLDPPCIAVGPLEEKRFLGKNAFLSLQKVVRGAMFLDKLSDEYDDEPGDSAIIRAMKAERRANRAKLARAKKVSSGNESDLEFSDLIASLATSGCGLNMTNIWDITYYAFHDQLTRTGWKEQFEINNRAALAGAKLQKNQLKHWIRHISDETK